MPGFPFQTKCEIAFTAPTAAPTFTDVSDRLIGFTTKVGDQRDYDGPSPGTLIVRLDNSDGALDPMNTSSPYAPNVNDPQTFYGLPVGTRMTVIRLAGDHARRDRNLPFLGTQSPSPPGPGRLTGQVYAPTQTAGVR